MTYFDGYDEKNEYLKNELQKMYQANRELQSVNVAVQNQYERLLQKVEPVERGNKRKLVDQKLACLSNGEVAIVNFYDNGRKELAALFSDIRGPWKVYRLDTEEDWTMPLFVIHFEGTDDWIAGQISKIRKSYFYDLLVQFGVRFDARITRSAICQVLYENFAGEVCLSSNKVKISALAGWQNGKFQFKENFILNDKICVSHFPVMYKSFEEFKFEETIPQRYFAEILKIKDKKFRFIVTVYPFLSLIASILHRCGKPLNFGVNFVDLSGIDKSRICGWFQSFNREVCMPQCCSMTERQFEKILHTVKDEVLILENIKKEDESYYKKCEKQKRINTALRIVLGDERLNGRLSEPVCAGMVVISDQFQLGKNIYNIYALDNWCEEEEYNFRKEMVISKLFSDFIHDVEKDMDGVEEIIMKKRYFQDKKEELLEIGCDIMSKYWGKKGIDFKQWTGLDAEIDFSDFFKDAVYEEEDLMELFIKSFRRSAKQYIFLPKKTKRREETAIYYGEDFLWYPVAVFDEILESSGLKQLKGRIIEMLKRTGILVTDELGVSKRIMINRKREEMYQLKRHVFQTEESLLDIVYMGRE